MRRFLFLSVPAVVCWVLWSCGSTPTGEEAAKTYQCSACKDMITWSYNPARGLPTGLREVKHTCPSCQKTWSAEVATKSTCGECSKEHMVCPLCQKKGG